MGTWDSFSPLLGSSQGPGRREENPTQAAPLYPPPLLGAQPSKCSLGELGLSQGPEWTLQGSMGPYDPGLASMQ